MIIYQIKGIIIGLTLGSLIIYFTRRKAKLELRSSERL